MTGGVPVGDPLPTSFYDRPANRVARELLGALLVSTVGGERAAGRIVETEAYPGPEDAASHAAERIGRTRRNDPMFGPPGIAYVYRIYGIHWCLNAVTGSPERPAAVLIRGLEPVEGLEVMRRRRLAAGRAPRRFTPDRDLARGPARLAQALGITGALDRHVLSEPPLEIFAGPLRPQEAAARGPRVGVTRAHDRPYRWFIGGSPWVSR